MKPKKVLVICDYTFPFSTGGAGRVIYEINKRLQKKGYDFTIISQSENNTNFDETVDGMRIIGFANPHHGLKFSTYRALQPIKIVKDLLKTTQFDLIHHHNMLSSAGIIMLKKNFNIPSLYTFHGPYDKELEVGIKHSKHKRGLLKKVILFLFVKVLSKLQGAMIKRVTTVITLSNYMKSECEEKKLNPNKVKIIPGGVDIKRFTPAENPDSLREKFGLPKNKKVLLTVRRLEARMGIHHLIDAMPKLIQKDPNIMLVIVGKGSHKDTFQNLIDNQNLNENVKLQGFVSEEDLTHLYQTASLFIMPSLALEGFGLSTLESLACGVPVVASPNGANPEILTQLEPTLVSKGYTSDALGSSIELALKNKWIAENPTAKQKCRDFATLHSWDIIADRYSTLYKTIEN
ncbi:hypothetical protein DID80_05850 [Candidatus Marinamargulisbacteria bacterium SCGC AAA071-K20]|nr:hypothetical protein DID80_05850 [Candidatus Marinamargulisbacteria bacterium SCGC AAA071-K20]